METKRLIIIVPYINTDCARIIANLNDTICHDQFLEPLKRVYVYRIYWESIYVGRSCYHIML